MRKKVIIAEVSWYGIYFASEYFLNVEIVPLYPVPLNENVKEYLGVATIWGIHGSTFFIVEQKSKS